MKKKMVTILITALAFSMVQVGFAASDTTPLKDIQNHWAEPVLKQLFKKDMLPANRIGWNL
ncbi:hypothetical protein [Paenibacillus wynnii]|uniref:SLH domain-containing protein n=1 Tax=Paenibacillus wynnii TaxID=268407 RepID=A0A098M6J0_9BACL|nr:hypothetical protein [Paenibacillus wynnii]KGE18195.1 hypothetical protein PWYN_27070 [Paenibacillus wynnii]